MNFVCIVLMEMTRLGNRRKIFSFYLVQMPNSIVAGEQRVLKA